MLSLAATERKLLSITGTNRRAFITALGGVAVGSAGAATDACGRLYRYALDQRLVTTSAEFAAFIRKEAEH